MPTEKHLNRLLFFLLGSKLSPYQHIHHGVLLIGGLGYLACSIFNAFFQTADVILSYAQFGLFLLIMLVWYRSRFHNQYRRMAVVFMFVMVLVALPINWIYNAGLAGPTYFLNLCTLAYISVAFRDFGAYRRIGITLVVAIPLVMMWLDLTQPEMIYSYPSELARALDLSFSFVVTAVLLLLMMGSYSRRYRLERDKAERLAKQLRILSEQDPLTGLYNRRAMDHYLDNLTSAGKVFTLAMLDLDHFKKLNDKHGHSYGDEVLCLYSEELSRLARDNKGIAVRLGGEEFVLVLPMPEAEAADKVQTLSVCLQELSLKHGVVTFSAGVAECYKNEGRGHLLRRVDHLLYAAKEAGRDRIFAAQCYPGYQEQVISSEVVVQ